MIFAYGLIALISLCMVGACVIIDKKRDLWLLLLVVSVSICNLGYFMLVISNDLPSALDSNKLSYLGSVFLPFFLLMMVLRFCGIKRNKKMTIVLAAIGIIMLGITTSPGVLPIYYSKVDVDFSAGYTKLVREYGAFHLLYYVYLFGYMLSMIGIAIVAVVKKKIQARNHTILLLCAVFLNIIIWFIEQFLPRGFEWLSVSYVLTEALILFIYHSMQKQKLLEWEGRTQSYTINVLLTVYSLLFANLVRIVTSRMPAAVYEISHVVILIIYVGILVAWGMSVYDRIVNKVIREYLIALVGLMMFWMLMRMLRLTVFYRVFPIGQWCWYAYYIPMILIPQICFFAAKHIGRPENYVISKKWFLMYIPSAILIIGILTNDLHQLAFRFHMGYGAGWDVYQRTYLYYAAVIWCSGCIVMMIAEILKGCRIPAAHKVIWVPIGMLGIGGLYTVLYITDVKMFQFIEMTAALCFILVAIWESCIRTGLIQANTHYDELLQSSDLGVTVTDQNFAVFYRSDDALPLAVEQMNKASIKPIFLENGIRVSGSSIHGGHTFWQDDLSELTEILEELSQLREELKDANTVSMKNYQMNKQIRALAEKNRLQDEINQQTAHQIVLLNGWLKEFMETEDETAKRELLCRIVVVGAYLKRRHNLILVNEQEGIIREEELDLSIQEMIKNLRLAGIDCACAVNTGRDIPSDAAMKLLDFYESIVEFAFDGLESLLARVFCRGESFYMSIDAVCSLDLTKLQTQEISVSLFDEGCYTVSFAVEGGADV